MHSISIVVASTFVLFLYVESEQGVHSTIKLEPTAPYDVHKLNTLQLLLYAYIAHSGKSCVCKS